MSKEYDIHVKLTLFTTKRVFANSLAEAAACANDLKASDIIPEKILRASNEAELEIEGAFRA